MAGKMQEGISVADLDADSLNESAENTQEDQIQDQIQNDQLEDAQLDDSLSPEHYDASDLRVLEGLEAVRIRPGMYIGSTGPRGLHHLVYEIVDNSVDEALAGYASHIEVTILPDGGVRVVDDGRGIPVDEVPGEGISGVETVMTKLHAGGKFGGGGYAVSGGLHGVGISVVNALSTRVDIEVRRQGFHWTQTYIDQKPTARLLKGKPMEEGESTGTSVTFWADGKIFETTTYDFEILRNRFQQMAFLNKGLKISLTDLREPDQAGDEVSGEESETEDKFQTVTYQYNDGIKDYVDYLVKSRKATPVEPDVIDFEAEDLKIGISAEIAMQWTTAYSEAVHTFANTISTTEGGTHEEGFRAALTSLVNRYAREKNILKDKDENLSGDDVREGLTAVVSVKLTNPQFEGQTKTKLGNSEMRALVDSVVFDRLSQFLEENPAVGRMIIEKALTASRAREAARRARENIRRKNGLEGFNMPDKLRDCNDRDPSLTELYIVEGDSAGGSATQGRDSRFQAILPLWGKMLNVEKARIDRVYGNEKLMPVVTALGTSIGEDFDIQKLRYGKVIIMADADVDGSHIRTLLLTFFFRFMRPLITNGNIYLAQPPLFKVFKGKKYKYAFDEAERDKYIAEFADADGSTAKVGVQRYKGLGEMSSEQLWETTMNPETRSMIRVDMEDAEKADEIFTILMGDKVAPRKEFIEKNARYVQNLDV